MQYKLEQASVQNHKNNTYQIGVTAVEIDFGYLSDFNEFSFTVFSVGYSCPPRTLVRISRLKIGTLYLFVLADL